MSSVKLPEGVRRVLPTYEKLRDLWEKVKNYEKLFSDDMRWDFDSWLARMSAPDTIILETNGGFMLFTEIKPGFMSGVHVCFFDHKLSARTNMLKECLIWAGLQYGIHRFEAIIPEVSRALQHFLVKKMGFFLEGRLRDRMLYHGQFIDVKVYSILLEEVK